MRQETLQFFWSICAGVVPVGVYCVLKAFRNVFSHSSFWIALEDLLFWIAAALFAFAAVYRLNQGSLRWFLLFAMLLGAVLSGLVLAPAFTAILTWILKIPAAAVKKMIKRLIFSGRRCKIWIDRLAASPTGACGSRNRKRRGSRQSGKITEKSCEKKEKK